jgi:hypothetical protein
METESESLGPNEQPWLQGGADMGFQINLPSVLRVRASDPEWPYTVVVEVDLTSYSPNIRSVSYEAIGDGAIHVASLRVAPIAEIVSQCLTDEFADGIEDDERLGIPWSALSDDDRLRTGAFLYRMAVLRMMPPTESVAKAMDASRSTAARLIARARDHGYLGQAKKTQGGEE